MRILHILNDVTDQGNGIVNAAVDIAIGQARLGHNVGIISSGGGHARLLASEGIELFPICDLRRPANLLKSLWAFRKRVSEFRPHVVHAHMRAGAVVAWLCSPFSEYALVAHIQNVHDRESVLMGLAQRTIVVSESVGTTMRQMGVPKRKIRVVLNRTLHSARLPQLSDVTPATLQRPSIVTVCGMYDRKGVAELIAAFEQIATECTNVHLYLVGDGPDRSKFEDQARCSSFFDRVHFEGFQENPQSYMLATDVFVLASRRESFGIVLIEARQAGCAIVASRVDGIPEALDGGEAGLLVEPRDIGALAAALRRLLVNQNERRVWQQKAKRRIENFEVSTMVQEVLSVYREVIPGARIQDCPLGREASPAQTIGSGDRKS